MLDVALGTACAPAAAAASSSSAAASIVHANDPVCRSLVPSPPPACNCGVSCRLFAGGVSAASLAGDPAVAGPLAYALALCASGNCGGGGSSSSSIAPVVTASDVAVANVSDPLVSISVGSGARQLALGAAAAAAEHEAESAPLTRRSLRRGKGATAAASGGLTFSRPRGEGIAQPQSINPAAVAAAAAAAQDSGGAAAAGSGRAAGVDDAPLRTPRRLDWYSESLATSYVPPTPALPGIPVTTRAAAAGPLGLGSSSVRGWLSDGIVSFCDAHTAPLILLVTVCSSTCTSLRRALQQPLQWPPLCRRPLPPTA